MNLLEVCIKWFKNVVSGRMEQTKDVDQEEKVNKKKKKKCQVVDKKVKEVRDERRSKKRKERKELMKEGRRSVVADTPSSFN